MKELSKAFLIAVMSVSALAAYGLDELSVYNDTLATVAFWLYTKESLEGPELTKRMTVMPGEKRLMPGIVSTLHLSILKAKVMRYTLKIQNGF